MENREEGMRATARFMFDESVVDRFAQYLERQERVKQMGARWAMARNVFTGEPLRGEEFLEWLDPKLVGE